MAGKADFMKREAELEEKIVERKPPVAYDKVEKVAERKSSEKVVTNDKSYQGFVDNCSKLNVR